MADFATKLSAAANTSVGATPSGMTPTVIAKTPPTAGPTVAVGLEATAIGSVADTGGVSNSFNDTRLEAFTNPTSGAATGSLTAARG